jgi:hypothetical protein
MNRPEGLICVRRVLDGEGKLVPLEKAIRRYGWIHPLEGDFSDWALEEGEIPVGKNLFVDNGRQALCYAFGNRSPITNFICQKFGMGTGTAAPKVTDVVLEAPVPFTGSTYTKAINGVDYPAPFIARVEFTIGAGECNGYLLTEMGLFTGDDTLLTRRTMSVGISKSVDFSPVLSHSIRF